MGAEATVAVVPGALLLEPPSKMALSILVQLTPPAVPLPPPDTSHTLSLGRRQSIFLAIFATGAASRGQEPGRVCQRASGVCVWVYPCVICAWEANRAFLQVVLTRLRRSNM